MKEFRSIPDERLRIGTKSEVEWVVRKVIAEKRRVAWKKLHRASNVVAYAASKNGLTFQIVRFGKIRPQYDLIVDQTEAGFDALPALGDRLLDCTLSYVAREPSTLYALVDELWDMISSPEDDQAILKEEIRMAQLRSLFE